LGFKTIPTKKGKIGTLSVGISGILKQRLTALQELKFYTNSNRMASSEKTIW
jgi:ABC-type transport system involved in cytochrome c biogenesis ATPase subunit